MGCASSTPLVTTGSDMLKAASHVAADATKSAENAVEDVTQTLGKTIDTAKESVGTAVTGIAHELSSTIKEKADETKAIVLDKLHLNNSNDDRGESNDTTADMLMKQNAGATLQLSRQHALGKMGDIHDGDDGDVDNEIGDSITQRLSRGPTPTPVQQDSDSLKTTISEPEIERALANRNGNRHSPPTPKPSISELERLSAELHDLRTNMLADAHIASPMVSNQSMSDVSTTHIQAEDTRFDLTTPRRPNTTEWEKYADNLARNKKFHPNEIALRRRLIGPHITTSIPTTLGATIITGSSMPAAGTEAATAAAQSMTTALPPSIPTKVDSKPSINVPQYFRDFPRSTTDINRFQGDDESGNSDRNNGSSSSPPEPDRYSTKLQRKRMTRNTTNTSSVKRMHRQLTSLMGYGYARSALPVVKRPSNVLVGRNFDFNPNRIRVGSPILPIVRKRVNQSYVPIKIKDPPRITNRLVNRIGSPVIVAPIKQLSRLAFKNRPPKQTLSSSTSSTPSRIGLYSFDRFNSASTRARTASQPPSSRSSTNNSIQVVIKSNCTTPISCSPSKNSIASASGSDVPANNVAITPQHQQVQSPLCSLPPSPSPEQDFVEDSCIGARGITHSPNLTKNTSSFLNSPRTSPFCVRKSYDEFEDKENKAAFVADLSSVTDYRYLRTPSPYKIRERCAVCYNKYTVK